MPLSRRTLLASAAATLVPTWSKANRERLTAEPVVAQILPEGSGTTPSLGFNGGTPGPVLRVRQGDELHVNFENRTGEPSSVHWHGIRIDNAMDGVPGLTQDAVPDGEDFEYRFVTPDAGTFWYHSHSRSWQQVAMGLYGPLIVEEREPPDVDADIIVMIDDWWLEQDGELRDDFNSMFHFSHAGRLGNYAKAIVSQSSTLKGNRVRLRLINVANARVFPVDIGGVEGNLVALDGMPLKKVEPIDTIHLAPAQRADIIADVAGNIEFSFWTGHEQYPLATIDAAGSNPSPRTSPIVPLPPNDVATTNGDEDMHVTLRMQGGAMGGQHPGDDIWSFNGVSGLPDEPWFEVQQGTVVGMTLVNDTSFPHGIHLHGQHFHEVDGGGKPGPLRDTTLVDARASRDIICVFGNPGKWLLHCHMLGHATTGMETWVEVT
ncbi:MAG: multicopper oxidase family protein [Boseongicola sp. SB0677_bin_26]|nr:multicopper oxidase family protein [Boseongicola sp. SB0665_bin_10]MYG26113.1 multicopper oxidase family protein [Boseongicola sp. SB0677_bin_26]